MKKLPSTTSIAIVVSCQQNHELVLVANFKLEIKNPSKELELELRLKLE